MSAEPDHVDSKKKVNLQYVNTGYLPLASSTNKCSSDASGAEHREVKVRYAATCFAFVAFQLTTSRARMSQQQFSRRRRSQTL